MSSDPQAPVATPKADALAPSAALADRAEVAPTAETSTAPSKPPIVNVANGLTVFRLALVPAFVVVIMHGAGAGDRRGGFLTRGGDRPL